MPTQIGSDTMQFRGHLLILISTIFLQIVACVSNSTTSPTSSNRVNGASSSLPSVKSSASSSAYQPLSSSNSTTNSAVPITSSAENSSDSKSSAYNVSALRELLGSNETEEFEIPTRLPNISVEIPPSWGGYQPVSQRPNETRQIYFWMFPATEKVGHDDLVIFFNGGPGCSSLSGVLGEQGPVKLNNVTGKAELNKYSWTNLTNMLWVDQPVGTGFSHGEAKNQSMIEIAKEFNGFLISLYRTFPKLHGKRLWLAGESYAGKFIPFIADQIYKESDQNKKAGINLQGINLSDAFFMNDLVGKELPAMQFARQHYKEMNITEKDMKTLEKKAKKIGIDKYIDTHLNYPPKGPLPIPKRFNKSDSVYSAFKQMAKKANPCFSPFYVISSAPCPLNPMGQNITTEKTYKNNYFNLNPSVKPLIHADNVTYVQCSQAKGFKTMQKSKTEFPLHTVLPSVIEKSNRTIILHGMLDYIMLPNGSALAIQNMTWGGKQGFQRPPTQKVMVDNEETGTYQSERKLTFITVNGASHMVAAYKPKPSYKIIQYMLGQISEDQLLKS